MTTSLSITNGTDKPSKGDLAYACARNQAQAHSMLVKAIRNSGLSQKELANIAGIDEASLSRLLSRPRNVELNTLSKLVYGACRGFVNISLSVPSHGQTIHLAAEFPQHEVSDKNYFFYSRINDNSSDDLIALPSNGVFFENALAADSTKVKGEC